MNLVSLRVITDDVDRLVSFYERVTGLRADRPTPDFAELRTGAGTLAIGHSRTVGLFAPGSAVAAANRSVILEFRVDDVDEVHERLTGFADLVAAPATLPWGNRSLLVRDPDGNLVNLFTPVTAEAVRRARR